MLKADNVFLRLNRAADLEPGSARRDRGADNVRISYALLRFSHANYADSGDLGLGIVFVLRLGTTSVSFRSNPA